MDKYRIQKPWVKFMSYIDTRCGDKKHRYHKKGIKSYLTVADLEKLWFRDKANLMNRPSIDRLNTKGNYTFDNCRFIEWIENCKQGGFTRHKRYRCNFDMAQEIRAKLKIGIKGIRLSEEYDVCPTSISNIKLNRFFKEENREIYAAQK